MAARLQLALAGVLALVAVALGARLVAGEDLGGPEPFTVGPSGLAGSLSPPDIRPRDFVLRDQDGERVALADLRGQVTVLTFLYTTCQDTCPIVATQIGSALEQLPDDASTVPALAVSVDPERDTPGLARGFLLKRGLTGQMRFVLGDRPALSRVWKAYGVQPQGRRGDPEAFEHSTYVAVIDKQGRQRVSFPLDQVNPAALAHDIARLQAEEPGRT